MKMFQVVLFCLIGGLSITWAAMGTGGFAWWWLSGILMAAAFVPLALYGPRTFWGQFGSTFPVFMVVTVLCLWSEALIFAPDFRQHAVRNLVGSAAVYGIMAVVLAILAIVLKLPREGSPAAQLRSPLQLIPLVLVCGLAYAFYYLLFGGITYQFFTKNYFPEAAAQVGRLGPWFWPLQIARGILMTLAVVPIIRALRLSRLQSAIAVGIVLWVAGGFAPLVLPNALMGPRQRFIHIIEIFTQNFSLGVTAVLLLRKKSSETVVVAHDAPVAAA